MYTNPCTTIPAPVEDELQNVDDMGVSLFLPGGNDPKTSGGTPIAYILIYIPGEEIVIPSKDPS